MRKTLWGSPLNRGGGERRVAAKGARRVEPTGVYGQVSTAPIVVQKPRGPSSSGPTRCRRVPSLAQQPLGSHPVRTTGGSGRFARGSEGVGGSTIGGGISTGLTAIAGYVPLRGG